MEKLKEYWDTRYRQGGTSGAGSYGVEAVTKANLINTWIKQYGIRTINEIGSGDGNNLLFYHVPISYTGYDLSSKAVELANEKTRKIKNSLKYFFTNNYDDQNFDADLCLCLDVWYHEVEDQDFEALCQTLFVKGKWKYIIAYTTDTDIQVLADGTPLADHLKFRPFLDTVKEFPQWEVLSVVTGFNTSDGLPMLFPNGKKFFLLKRFVDVKNLS